MVVARKTTLPVVRKQFAFNVDERLYLKIVEQARQLDMSPTRYAQSLFEAAYAARHGNTGDPIVETVVGAALVLWGLKFDVPTIARNLNLTEPQVELLISRWRAVDRRDRKAA